MKDRRGHRVPLTALPSLVVIALVAACGSPTPSAFPNVTTGPTIGPVTATPTASTPTAAPATTSATAAAGAPPCTAADLKASHGLIEGAAGSRLFEVILVSAVACSVDAFPTLGIRDATGAAIVGGVAAGPGQIDLSPEASYASPVRLSNWCVADPAFPLSLEIRLGSEELAVTGPAFEDESDLPPCNGDGGANLEAGAWAPGP
ncbi:MAG TPA: hypothetical protein VFP56_05000 [Candidatus Limnocylindrales bacterium]|nr:hypothetical protein [Candidatus Limnocylindrales bacterium]